jgi:hypothetical protein
MRALVFAALLTPACASSPTPSAFPPTKTAATVYSELQAAGCAPDGGLPALEQLHARYDRPAAVDCLFGADGSVQACGCPVVAGEAGSP